MNGELFTKSDLETRQIAALREMGQRLDPANTNLDDAQLRKMLDQVTPELMVSVIDEMLLVQRGRELGYRLGDEQFTGILDNIKKENKIENDEQFQAALKQERHDARRPAAQHRAADARAARRAERDPRPHRGLRRRGARVLRRPPLGVHRAAEHHPARNLRGDARVRRPPRRTPRRARRPLRFRQRANAGENFEKLAVDMSDAPSKANAGLIGPLNLNELSPDLRKLIESMKPGQISELLKTARGYQLLKLETSTPPETLPFDQARNQIGERVFTDKRREEYDKFLERLRAQAIIEWKNDELKRAYEQGLSESKKQGSRGRARLIGCWRAGSPSGRARGTNRSSASSSRPSRSTRFCRRSRSGAVGRTAGRRSTGRCFPAIASHASIRTMPLPVLKCTGVVSIVSFEGKPAPIPEYELDQHPRAGRERPALRSLSLD